VSRSGGLGIVIICAAALVLRSIGIQYGLPAVYNPDEVAIMSRALSFATGTLNPHNFLYPTFYFYVLFAWVGAYLAFVWITGGVESLSALSSLYFTNPTGIYTAGRMLGVVAGTATVFALYRLAAKLTDSRTALGAALLLAVAPLAVRDSHYVKHDVPATLAVVVAYLAMSRLWPCAPSKPQTRDTLVAGAACGVAFSTHYYCVFLALPLAFSVYQGWKAAGPSTWLRQLLWGGAVSVVVFFALSPFLLVEPLTAWRDITANREIVIDRGVGSGAFAPARRYVEMLFQESVPAPMTVIAVLGAIFMSISMPGRAFFLLSFPVSFLLFIANTAPASRYLNVVVPFIALFAARMAWWSVVNRWKRARVPIFWVIVTLSAAPAAAWSVRTVMFFRQDDTRTLAKRYVEANIPAESTILIQPYSAPLTPSRAGLMEALTRNLGSADAASTKFRLQLALEPYPSPAYRLLYLGRGGLDQEKIYVDPADLGRSDGLEPLKRLGVAYLIVTRYNRPDPVTLPFLTTLAREGRMIAVFSPYRTSLDGADQRRIDPFLHNTDARIDEALERPGPRLEIWQLK
jgi:Dolichyl-phosphate-mannose-protein mannosyltransferase